VLRKPNRCAPHALDLTNQVALQTFSTEKPTQVLMAAAKVGGIQVSGFNPANFIYKT
jgi:GDP-L-fucose synthase